MPFRYSKHPLPLVSLSLSPLRAATAEATCASPSRRRTQDSRKSAALKPESFFCLSISIRSLAEVVMITSLKATTAKTFAASPSLSFQKPDAIANHRRVCSCSPAPLFSKL
ncbi:hypothetical protein TIFTF001_028874 [Ficus carica]|uniref:Secreted protein n=1 Tax=Ficus carica TaxID=3494 RepID=A0AA88J2L2_FICCA|nr:hypothetical protein TIFTF001_028874 [Ficus carica]